MDAAAHNRPVLDRRGYVLVGCVIALAAAAGLDGLDHWFVTIYSAGTCGGAWPVGWRLEQWVPPAVLALGAASAWLRLRRRRAGLICVAVLVVATGWYLVRWHLPVDTARTGSAMFCYGPDAGSRAYWAQEWHGRLTAPVDWLPPGVDPAAVLGALAGIVAVLTTVTARLPAPVPGRRWGRRDWAVGAVTLGLIATAWLPWWRISSLGPDPNAAPYARTDLPLWSASVWWIVAVLLGVAAGVLWLRQRGPAEPPRWLPLVVLGMLATALLMLGGRALTAPTGEGFDLTAYPARQSLGPGVLVAAGLLTCAALLVGSTYLNRLDRVLEQRRPDPSPKRHSH